MAAANFLEDPIVLATYVERFRVVFRTRLVSVTALVLAVGMSFSAVTAAQFAVAHYALFALYIWAVEHAGRRSDEPRVVARLKVQSLVLSCLIACHSTWLAIHVDAAAPTLHPETVLLLITLTVLAGLQVHLSWTSFLLTMAAPLMGLAFITRHDAEGSLTAHLWAGVLFSFAILAASGRQQLSDRQSARAAADLARRNAELEAALVDAEAASRAKSDFLALTSHEVRTPLNAVLGMAGVLARETTSPRHGKLARGIELAGGSLLRLLNGILELTRLDAGAARASPAEITALMERVETGAQPGEPPAIPERDPSTDAEPGRRLRILAAEDNAANRQVLKLILTQPGLDLEIVEDGAQAVAAFAAGDFDVVLMDARMPVMGGLDAVRAIRHLEAASGRRTPIAMVTANTFPDDIAAYEAAGADRVVPKPIEVSTLLGCLEQLLDLDEGAEAAVA